MPSSVIMPRITVVEATVDSNSFNRRRPEDFSRKSASAVMGSSIYLQSYTLYTLCLPFESCVCLVSVRCVCNVQFCVRKNTIIVFDWTTYKCNLFAFCRAQIC